MTTRPDPDTDALLIDLIRGELPPAEAAGLQARLAADPELARAHAALLALDSAERDAFEPPARVAALAADAPRVAAWVRDAVRSEEQAAAHRARTTTSRSRNWARVMALSIAAHVVVLGVLALVLHGGEGDGSGPAPATVSLDDSFAFAEYDEDFGGRANAHYYESLVQKDLGERFDDLAMLEQETLADLPEDLEDLLREEPVAWGGQAYPVGVVVPMTRRTTPGLKRRRLDLLGFNAAGTLTAVERGLRYLEKRQRADGAFGGRRGEADASTLETTALCLLAFLGEGHTSQGSKDRDAVVGRGVGLLRRRALARAADGATRVDVAEPGLLGPVTVALCEDYMLGYGSLTPNAARERAGEIQALASMARVALDDGAQRLARMDRTWLVWALDSAQRAGLVQRSARDRSRFEAWVAAASDPAAGGAADASAALSVAAALLYAERGSAKPRFLDWSRTNAEKLVARLDPRGAARSGDPLADTARILLVLQVSYRTY